MALKIRDILKGGSSKPLVMGILNVTPDSFSDGGDFFDLDRAVLRAMKMIEEGADLIDVGPESTRPGSHPVSADEQISRAIPVIRAIRKENKRISISIDTTLAAVAFAAIESGAGMVNDTSALRDDPELAATVAQSQADLVIMHRRGTPAEMQKDGGPQYEDVIGEICEFLRERADFAQSKGIDRSRIIIDPGIGYGKRNEHNLLIIKELRRFCDLGYPVLFGASRKRFLGSILQDDDTTSRDLGTLVTSILAVQAGVSILRVHDVQATVNMVRMMEAMAGTRVSAHS